MKSLLYCNLIQQLSQTKVGKVCLSAFVNGSKSAVCVRARYLVFDGAGPVVHVVAPGQQVQNGTVPLQSDAVPLLCLARKRMDTGELNEVCVCVCV